MNIRFARPQEQPMLASLADLDGLGRRWRPDGPVLVAEVDGRVIAARSLDGPAISDPFVPAADVVALLGVRARQLGGKGRRTPRRRALLRPRLS